MKVLNPEIEASKQRMEALEREVGNVGERVTQADKTVQQWRKKHPIRSRLAALGMPRPPEVEQARSDSQRQTINNEYNKQRLKQAREGYGNLVQEARVSDSYWVTLDRRTLLSEYQLQMQQEHAGANRQGQHDYTEALNPYLNDIQWLSGAEHAAYQLVQDYFKGAPAGERLNPPHHKAIANMHPALQAARSNSDGSYTNLPAIRAATEASTRMAIQRYVEEQKKVMDQVVEQSDTMSEEKLDLVIAEYQQPSVERMMATNPDVAVSQKRLEELEAAENKLEERNAKAEQAISEWQRNHPIRSRLEAIGIPAPSDIQTARDIQHDIRQQQPDTTRRLEVARQEHGAIVSQTRQQVGRQQMSGNAAVSALQTEQRKKQYARQATQARPAPTQGQRQSSSDTPTMQ